MKDYLRDLGKASKVYVWLQVVKEVFNMVLIVVLIAMLLYFGLQFYRELGGFASTWAR